jgi:hypothetical protein
MCLDHNAMLWLQAWMDHKDAPKGKMGLVYMLRAAPTLVTMIPLRQRRRQGESG